MPNLKSKFNIVLKQIMLYSAQHPLFNIFDFKNKYWKIWIENGQIYIDDRISRFNPDIPTNGVANIPTNIIYHIPDKGYIRQIDIDSFYKVLLDSTSNNLIMQIEFYYTKLSNQSFRQTNPLFYSDSVGIIVNKLEHFLKFKLNEELKLL